MARALERLFTIEDWLAYEGEGDTLYELVDGRLVAMSPPKAWHGDIATEVAGICREALRDRFPCRVRAQAGIEIAREPKAKGYIADLAVTCEPYDENRPTMFEPRLVIEILSESTGRLDKTDKLEGYKSLPSVEEIWLVVSTTRLVLQAVRGAEGWGRLEAFIGRASFHSPVLGVPVALDDIYRYTPMGRPAEAEEGQEPGAP
jgi:Uma2 family endonuclease